MTRDEMTVEEMAAEIVETLPPKYMPAWFRMGIRLANGYPMAKAEALFYKEVAAAGD